MRVAGTAEPADNASLDPARHVAPLDLDRERFRYGGSTRVGIGISVQA